MVKFFLKNDKNPPKFDLTSKSSNFKKKSEKTKNVLDYRIVIWKKLFNLIRAEHSIMIQKIIRKIKDKTNKIYLISEQMEIDPANQQRMASLQKEIQRLDSNYEELKHQKKKQLKLITIYLIIEVLKIQNIEKILEKAKLSSTDIKQVKSTVQNNQSHKKFVEKLSQLTIYQEELEKCAKLLDTVQEKKLERKQKMKERKNRKYQREHGIVKQAEDSKIDQVLQSNQKQAQPQSQYKQNVQNNRNSFATKSYHQEKFKVHQLQSKNRISYDNNSRKNEFEGPKGKKQFEKFKPIHKQRSQFKKTGRNKVKQQKEQRKYQQKKNQNHKDIKQRNEFTKSNNKQYNFSKQMAHPSWQAKQQQKQQVFIKPFEGKKILL